MRTHGSLVVATAVALAALATPARGAVVQGLVYDDVDHDDLVTAGEPGVPGVVVAFGPSRYATTDAAGRFQLEVPDGTTGIVWARVPDGFVPGPAWTRWDGAGDVELALHRLPAPVRGPLTFVVAADTHLGIEPYLSPADLGAAVAAATALDPGPAFFTILGDVTQGNRDDEFDQVEQALAGLGVPWIPVPGNHDWYDGGDTWFRRLGPDNYSFDVAGVHVVVWNMMMDEAQIRAYLGAELSHVAPDMTVVALTHAPPAPSIVEVLRLLGVDYVLTGHAHSNRVVDHDGVLELGTEPLLMGGLDATPAGYRVVTIDAGRLRSYHRAVVERPYLSVVAPARDACAPARGAELLAGAELDAGGRGLSARIDCGAPIALRHAGGLTWRAQLPALAPGPHAVVVEARSAAGRSAQAHAAFVVCDPGPPPPPGDDWPQLGGGPAHLGARARPLSPPLAPRWTVAVGEHVVTAAPAIAGGVVFVVTTDLADGGGGGVVALELASGARRWRYRSPVQLRGGPAVVGDVVVVAQIDGVVLGLDVATGAPRWRHALAAGAAAQARAVFAAPAADGPDVLVGSQREVAALDAATGQSRWSAAPVLDGHDTQSLAAIAVGDGVAAGVFHRELGGLVAWDRATGRERWRVHGGEATVAINASPVIVDGLVLVVSGGTDVTAYDVSTGAPRWHTRLDPRGFEWGNATVGAPAVAHGVAVVPTLYRDLVALDVTTGAERWRYAASPGPLRTTHYRGAGEAGFAASPVIAGDIVWAADTSGRLSALALQTGELRWQGSLGGPVLAGLAASGDWLVVGSFDGTVRALAPAMKAHGERPGAVPQVATCPAVAAATGAGTARELVVLVALLVAVVALGVLVVAKAGGGAREGRAHRR